MLTFSWVNRLAQSNIGLVWVRVWFMFWLDLGWVYLLWGLGVSLIYLSCTHIEVPFKAHLWLNKQLT